MNLTKAVSILLFVIAVVYILNVTAQYAIPFVIALLIWYFIKEIKRLINRNDWIHRKMPRVLQDILVILIIFGILAVIATLLASSIESFSKEIPKYEANVQVITDNMSRIAGFDLIESARSFSGNVNFGEVIQPVLNNLSAILSNGFMMLLYVVFLIMEESLFNKKIQMIFKDEEKNQRVFGMIQQIDESFSSYFSLKTLMSLLTGCLSFLVLYFLNVDAPLLWAIIIFLLNYIPSIGSLIATIFPTIIAMLQTGDILFGIYVLLGVSVIQLLVGNVIEPKVMGNSLNISPLVVIISLVVWGAIWGVLGMFLSVPITVIMIILFSQFPSTRGIAILLSADGKV